MRVGRSCPTTAGANSTQVGQPSPVAARPATAGRRPGLPGYDLCFGVLVSSVETIFSAAGGTATRPISTISFAETFCS